MRQAIITKFIGPTNYRGARVKATAEAGSVTIPWDHAQNPEDNHITAAKFLMQKFGWDKHNEILGGGYKNGYVFVMVDKNP